MGTITAPDEGAPLADYGLIGDRRSAALVSRAGSIDWCCMPRFDSGALFCRLLDRERGGHCSLAPREAASTSRRYVEGTVVLETEWDGPEGRARVSDCFVGPAEEGRPTIVRVIDGLEGAVDFEAAIVPRFDYGQVKPWIRCGPPGFAAIGGDDGLLVQADFGLEMDGRHALAGRPRVGEGERRRMAISFRRPVELDDLGGLPPIDPEAVDEQLAGTVEWWREWSSQNAPGEDPARRAATRSALVLKALSYEPTGAICAAPTTSLPESRALDGARNWDYRYAWIRDSALAVRSLAELGWEEDADRFRRFIERSSAGHASDLQVLFGVGGERRMAEVEEEGLAGYRGAAPVRIGNSASRQFQLDAFGQLVDQSWRWHRRGNAPDDDYWRFVADLVETAIARWRQPDRGIWEWRGAPRHFVHSKALAWAAVDRGIRLARDTEREVPEGWPAAREEIRRSVEANGYDGRRGCFVQAFGHGGLDAAVLRLPTAGFLDWRDERMISTASVIRDELDLGGLLRRYDSDDGMPEEGAFLPCSFWLATCLARQGRGGEAREVFEAAAGTANDLGLLAEEYDPAAGRMLGHLPQALTHLSHIEAVLALAGSAQEGGGRSDGSMPPAGESASVA